MLPDSAYVLYDDYDGTAEEIEPVRRMVAAIGGARCALLRNHGVFVVGDTIEQAYLNALSLEWRCRQAWMVRALAAGSRSCVLSAPARPTLILRVGLFLSRGHYSSSRRRPVGRARSAA